MWNLKNKNSADLTMCEGDYGIEISFLIEGISVSKLDTIELVVKTEKNGKTVLDKTFVINDDLKTFDFEFDEDESMLLKVGTYVYRLDLYRDGVFLCNIVNNAKLKVEDKI